MPISVSIVEDDRQLRGSFSSLLVRGADLCCVSVHATAEEALLGLPQVRPDVVLMDINLPGINGVECVRQIKPQLPSTQFIMFTVFENTEHIFKALAAGATGYLLKRTPPSELLDAIKIVHTGGSPMSSHIARKIVQVFQQPLTQSVVELENLSQREVQILDLLSKGFFYKEIAAETNLAFATIHTHIRNIYRKLQVRSRTEAVAKHLGFSRSIQELAGVHLL